MFIKLLVFNLSDEYYGISMRDIKEFKSYRHFYRYDNKINIWEMMREKTEGVGIIDLKQYLNLGQSIPGDNTMIIIIANSNKGFVVDRVDEFKSFNIRDFQIIEGNDNSDQIGIVACSVSDGDRTIRILDAEAISLIV